MNTIHPVPICSHRDLGRMAAMLALAIPLQAFSAELATANTIHVKVFPDHYAVDEQRFGDLAALQAALAHGSRAVVRLDHCGPMSVGPLLAAVEGLHDSAVDVLEIRPLPNGVAGCVDSNAALRGGRGGPAASAAYLETDRSGRSLIP